MPTSVIGGQLGIAVKLLTDEFRRDFRRLQAVTNQAAKKSIRIPVAMAGAAVAATQAASVVFAAREAMDMEDRMFRLGRVTGLTGDRLHKLGDQFKDMAANMTGVHLEDVFDIAEMGAKLGVTGPKLQMFTADVAKMRAVFDEADIPLAEMVTGIARLSSVFHHGTEDTIRFAAVINKLDLSSTASARDILNVSQRMAGFASMAGMTAVETMALSTALRQAGVPIETAGTSIGQILQRMSSSKDMGQFAKMAGMTRKEFEKLIRVKPFESIKAVAKGLAGMDFVTASRALEKVHLDGQRVRGTELALGRVLKELSTYLADANQEWKTQASILGGYNEKAETTGAQLTLMWNNAKLLGEEFGKHLLPVVKGFANGVLDMARNLRSFLKENKAWFEGWGQSVGRVFENVTLLFTNFTDVSIVGMFKARRMFDKVFEVGRRAALFLREVFTAAFRYISDVASQIFDNVMAKIHNKIAGVLNPIFAKMPDWMRPDPIKNVDVPKVDFKGPASNFGMTKEWFRMLFVQGGIIDDLPDRQPNAEQKKSMETLAKREKELREARGLGAKQLEWQIRLERLKNAAQNKWNEMVKNFIAKRDHRPDRRTRSERLRDMANQQRATFNAMVRQQMHAGQRPPKPFNPVKAPFGNQAPANARDMMDPKVRAAVEAAERRQNANQRKAFGDMIGGPQAAGGPGAKAMETSLATLGTKLDALTRAMDGIQRMMAMGGQAEPQWSDMPRV